ncbi:MAG TPA: acyl-CoA dehydrogenase family protein [Burkholderiales bacterium]|nr:acyl-CoA dehydrogenase family protein [Burkholderiales bacterium]
MDAGPLNDAKQLQAARDLAPMIRASADEIDRNRELPRPLFEALADAGMFHMAVPREIGGGEIDFPIYVRVIEELGKADASTAWAVNQGATYATYSARIASASAAREIWIDTPRSVVSNSPGATAKAVVVPGGYIVSGRQGFSTGCRHASWIAANTTVYENGEVRLRDGKPEARYCVLPVAQAEILDTWHTRGMRGTGTHHFEVKDVFVPEERTYFPRGMPALRGGPRYKIPSGLSFAAGDAAVALAVSRSCLDAFYDLAGAKVPRYTTNLLRDQPTIQLSMGQAEAALRSGRAFLMQAVEDIWADATTMEAVTVDRRVALRLAATHAIRLAAQIVDAVYNAAGATAAFEGNLIQRHFQDIHVITQHVQGRLAHYETAGKYWLGLPLDESHL